VNGAYFDNHQPNIFSFFCAKPLVRRIQLHLQHISWSCHVCSQVGSCYIVIDCIEHFAVLDKTRYSSVLSEWHQWFRPCTCVVALDPFFWGPLCTSGRFAQHLIHACHFIHHIYIYINIYYIIIYIILYKYIICIYIYIYTEPSFLFTVCHALFCQRSNRKTMLWRPGRLEQRNEPIPPESPKCYIDHQQYWVVGFRVLQIQKEDFSV
jgi:hypothetical protein